MQREGGSELMQWDEALRELGFTVKGRVWGRPLVYIREPAPLIGAVFIGVIDRGTNVLQVRPTTLCPLSCIFCSVDAGPRSRFRRAEFMVEPGWLVEWVERVARSKGVQVEALIDGVGDPLTYPWIAELVEMLKSSRWVQTVALETHGAPLSPELIRRLDRAGLDRVNLSLDSLDPAKARFLAGAEWYDVDRVRRMAELIVSQTSIDLHVTPVWLPGVNDNDIVDVVRWAVRVGAGKRWPPATVQKYIRHRFGRNPRGVREPSWAEFWAFVDRVSRETGVRLRQSMEEWGMRYAPRVDTGLRDGDVVKVQVAAPGWLRGELLAVTLDGKWLVTVAPARGLRVGDIVAVRLVRTKDNILVGKPH